MLLQFNDSTGVREVLALCGWAENSYIFSWLPR